MNSLPVCVPTLQVLNSVRYVPKQACMPFVQDERCGLLLVTHIVDGYRKGFLGICQQGHQRIRKVFVNTKVSLGHVDLFCRRRKNKENVLRTMMIKPILFVFLRVPCCRSTFWKYWVSATVTSTFFDMLIHHSIVRSMH